MPATSKAIREYLERNNVSPTGDAKKDMAAAKKIRPDYKNYLKSLNT